ncbi:hypothetical protein [Paenibacillus sp. TY11]|uniref:hypothetical protein n=1 Tax=Paenibacillus sp. TY11 TaxID=3448633 RepID=UPI0040390793
MPSSPVHTIESTKKATPRRVPTVTNGANSPGSVTFRVVDDTGAQVGSTKTVAAGKSVELDTIPWNAGDYTLQGKASKTGYYNITID